jgi:hypothetical protein
MTCVHTVQYFSIIVTLFAIIVTVLDILFVCPLIGALYCLRMRILLWHLFFHAIASVCFTRYLF